MVVLEIFSGVDQGLYAPLFNVIGKEFGVSPGDLVWVASLPLLFGAMTVPLLSRLGDMYGHRMMLRISAAIALFASICMAVAPTYGIFLIGRTFQGVISVWLPLEIAIVTTLFSTMDARRTIGLLAGTLTFGVAAGSLAGGYIYDWTGSLRFTLWVPVVLVIACCVATWFIPESTARAPRNLDIPGFAGLALGIALLQFALFQAPRQGWGSTIVVSLLATGLIVILLWILWELKTKEPAIDVRMLSVRTMWPMQLSAMFFGMAMYGNQASIVQFLGASQEKVGYGFDLDPRTLALVVLPSAVVGAFGAANSARMSRRIGLRLLAQIAAATVAAGFLSLTLFHSSISMVVVATIIFGGGFGVLMGSIPSLISEQAPKDSVGLAAGMYNSVRVLGGALIGGVFAAVLQSMLVTGTKIPTVDAYKVIWIGCAILAILVAALISFGPRSATQDEEEEVVPELRGNLAG